MPTYFWDVRCEKRCSFHFTSSDPSGDPAWPKTCPYDGSKLTPLMGASEGKA